MLRNYLITAFRNLFRERTNSILNIAGLTLGITGSLLLFLIVHQGNQFDQHHENRDRIFRIVSSSKGNSGESFTQASPPVLPASLKSDFQEIEQVAFTSYRRNNLLGITKPNGSVSKHKEAKGVVFTQNSFFKIFDRKLLSGDEEKVLIEPNKALISEAWAEKFFLTKDVLGKEIQYDNVTYEIEGLVEDYPTTTDLPFDLMLSYSTIQDQMEDRGWGSLSDSDNCYFLLKEGYDIVSVNAGLSAFVSKHYGVGDENREGKNFVIQPLADLHSDMRFGNYNSRMPFMAQVAFSVIGVFLLLTCCINFINLTTATAVKRNKEIGIRKVLGSSRLQLILQLLGESLLVTIVACAISIFVGKLLLPVVNNYLDLNLSLNLNTDLFIWIYLILLIVVVTLLSGMYPAWILSGARTGHIISGPSKQSYSGFTLRKSLIVAQFFISQFFIIATLVIYNQFQHMQRRDLGFVKDAIINVPIPVQERNETIQSHSSMRALKSEMLRISGVEKVSLNNTPPAANSVVGTSFTLAGSEEPINTQLKEIDGDYIDVFGLELLAGNGLSDLDTMSGFVVNEALAHAAGFSDYNELIGREIDLWGNKLAVKGVVKDFSSTSPSDAIKPLMMINNLDGFKNLSLKLSNADIQQDLQTIQAYWEKAYPEHIFEYSFMDDDVDNLYKGERKTSAVLAFFASIAIFIGCLGLFGLVTFMANNKTKEIGIRKVMGASVPSVVWLFSKEFIKLILIGFALAAPLAAFVMNMVLEEFAYKITLGPLMFISGLLFTFIVAFVTVGFRSISAALANPVEALRSE
ncbi:ABC-type antimicrobial peptide transport system permease subunit [Algoriphagus sp. 4150]|uniref:ABC transporter permease n=1 Tax=Algoriphagus sp. 4150 TaxID=2817756 RepID=UPI0028606D54|nr:ABC transporter permease [Algoriphagus sp. 4150]MDR7129974.1 ABC-type antimicrobial peptide transport system permease subunit [Algoriphagus sp. 4150]